MLATILCAFIRVIFATKGNFVILNIWMSFCRANGLNVYHCLNDPLLHYLLLPFILFTYYLITSYQDPWFNWLILSKASCFLSGKFGLDLDIWIYLQQFIYRLKEYKLEEICCPLYNSIWLIVDDVWEARECEAVCFHSAETSLYSCN